MGQVCFVLHAVRSRGQNFRLSSSPQFSKCFSLIGQSNDLFNFRRVVMQMGSIIHSGEKGLKLYLRIFATMLFRRKARKRYL